MKRAGSTCDSVQTYLPNVRFRPEADLTKRFRQVASERDAGVPVASLIIPQNRDFNGACGYVAELNGSGIMISEASFTEASTFRLFATDAQL